MDESRHVTSDSRDPPSDPHMNRRQHTELIKQAEGGFLSFKLLAVHGPEPQAL